jgi:teichuronic acid biosynthesis glycosyltransferase TuaH
VPSPIAAVVGQLNFRIDLALLEAVLDRGLSLLLVGPVDHPERERMTRLLADPRVQSVGMRPVEEVARYLRRADLGLVPYNHCAFNESSFPLKTLEYLAARLPVVSTDLPATRWLDTPLVAIADDPDGFASAAHRLVGLTSSDVDRTKRWRFAQEHSYAKRAEALLAAIEHCAARPDVVA